MAAEIVGVDTHPDVRFVKRPPEFADAKARRRVLMADNIVGTLTRLPGGRTGTDSNTRKNRLTVIVGGHYTHPTIGEIVAVESPTTGDTNP